MQRTDCRIDHTRTTHAHVDDAVGFADAVESAGHERVVLGRIGKDDQLCAADAAAITGQLGGLLDNSPHQGHGIHVDACLGGRHVDRGTDLFRHGKRPGDRGDEPEVAGCHPFLHQGAEAADEIDARLVRGTVQGLCHGNQIIGPATLRHDGDGSDGDPLVDDGNAVEALNVFGGPDQVFGTAHDARIDLLAENPDVGMAAAAQIYAHGDRPDVQVLIGHHLDGFENFFRLYRHVRASSDPVHEAENVFMLHDDLYAQFFADSRHGFLEGSQVEAFGLHLGQHDHGEQMVHDTLPDVCYVHGVLSHDTTDACHDPDPILTDDRDDETT